MNRIEINVSGATGTGKSIVLRAIDRALKDLGVSFRLSDDLEQERNMYGSDSPPSDWEKDLIGKFYVVLTETNLPR